MSKLINISFHQGVFPDILKTAKVIPLFKKGDHFYCNNYRPISLLPVFSKIFEKCFYSRLYNFLDKYDLIYKRQFGFRTKHSTNDALLNLIETTKKMLDSGNFVCSVFLDLQKAFDTVDHNILISKLNFYGIRGCANSWIKTFLCGRQQFSYILSQCSTLNNVKCGVPQGSTLGPLLFLLYINDLNTVFKKVISNHFADDTYLIYSSSNLSTIESVFNHELKMLIEWLRCNKLSLNESKSEMILFRSKRKICDTSRFSLKLNNFKLKPVSNIKYLGLFIDENLNWDLHLEKPAQKLSQCNGIISKLRHFLTARLCVSIYYSIFYSHLLYGSIVWQFTSKKNIDKIVKLQKKFMRLISFSDFTDTSNPLFILYKIMKVEDVLIMNVISFFVKLKLDILPKAIKELFSSQLKQCTRELHENNCLSLSSFNSFHFGKNSMLHFGASSWNHFYSQLPDKEIVSSINK